MTAVDHTKAAKTVGDRLDLAANEAHQLAGDLETAVDHCQTAIALCRRLRARLD